MKHHLRFLLLVTLPLVLALAMFTASATTINESKRTLSDTQEKKLGPEYNDRRAFFLACVWSQYSCKGVDRPYVEYKEMSEPRLYGHYTYGDDTIFINEAIRGTKLGFTAIIHETIHYLQYKSGAWDLANEGGWDARCGLEEEAFNVAYRVTQALGWEYDYTWRGWDAMRAFTYDCVEDPPNPTLPR